MKIKLAKINKKTNALVVAVNDCYFYLLHNNGSLPARDWGFSLKGFQRASYLDDATAAGMTVTQYGEWLDWDTATHQLRAMFEGGRRRRSSSSDKGTQAAAAPVPTPAPTPAPSAADTLTALAGALTSSLAPALTPLVEAAVAGRVDGLADRLSAMIEDKVNAAVAAIPSHEVTLKVDTGRAVNEVKGIQHPKLQQVIKLTAAGKKVYMFGPAGSGKNIIAKQTAGALGLPFYSYSQVTMKHELTGYADAQGRYVATDFFRAFTTGGLFFFDELDSSSPDAVVAVNQAIENRYFEFPTHGMIQAHEDFRVIAAGNTCGVGATAQYTGRAALDASTLNRFIVVHIDYDAAVENAIAPAPVVTLCRAIRSYCAARSIDLVVSYRTMTDLATALAAGFSLSDALDTAVFKYQLPASQVDDVKRSLNKELSALAA